MSFLVISVVCGTVLSCEVCEIVHRNAYAKLGDAARVTIAPYTNIQDRAVLTTSTPTDELDGEINIGHYVTIGHGAVLDSCTVENNALIGIQAVIGPGARVGAYSQVAAGSYVEPNTQIPSGQLWAGNPAVFKRELSEDEKGSSKTQAKSYANLAQEHFEALETSS